MRPPCESEPEKWFPTFTTPQADIQEALALCAECPFKQECNDRYKPGYYGIWGGKLRRLV